MEQEVESRESGVESGEFQIVDGELLEVSTGDEIEPFDDEKTKIAVKTEPKTKDQKPKTKLPDSIYFCSADFSDRCAARRFTVWRCRTIIFCF